MAFPVYSSVWHLYKKAVKGTKSMETKIETSAVFAKDDTYTWSTNILSQSDGHSDKSRILFVGNS